MKLWRGAAGDRAPGGREPAALRRMARTALLVVGVLAMGAAGFRYVTTRDPEAGRALRVTPVSGPVGTHPIVELSGWSEEDTVTIRFCTAGRDPRCADLGRGRGTEPLRLDPIPANLTDAAGADRAVEPGPHEIVATSGDRTERAPFEVIAFGIGGRPTHADWSGTDPSDLEIGPARRIADGAGCLPVVVPDGRILVGRTLFDPATAVTYDAPVQGHELVWAPDGSRLAIVTADRKEIRLADPDGTDAVAVVREARGLLASVSWSPDADRFAFVARPDPSATGGPSRSTVSVFNLTDGARSNLGPGETVAWSPAEPVLLVEVAEAGSRVIYRSTLEGQRTKLVDGRRPAWSPDGSLVAFVRVTGGDTGEAWLVAAGGGTAHRAVAGEDVCGIAFSAAGRQLVVSTQADRGFALDLRRLSAASGPD